MYAAGQRTMILMTGGCHTFPAQHRSPGVASGHLSLHNDVISARHKNVRVLAPECRHCTHCNTADMLTILTPEHRGASPLTQSTRVTPCPQLQHSSVSSPALVFRYRPGPRPSHRPPAGALLSVERSSALLSFSPLLVRWGLLAGETEDS